MLRRTGSLIALICVGCGGGIDDAAIRSIASDATGEKLVAVGAGLWASSDGGDSWTRRSSSKSVAFDVQDWTSVASDAKGKHLVAVVNGFYDMPVDDPAAYGGDVWTSDDSGVTWTDRTTSGAAHGQAWRSVASDSTGMKLVAATYGSPLSGSGAIWTSIDGGATWVIAKTDTEVLESWESVASSADGQRLAAAGNRGLWTSSDGGVTWHDGTPADPKFEAVFGDQMQGWSAIASDASGLKLVAIVDAGDIWTSSDGGFTWRDDGPTGRRETWIAVASDATGTNLIAVNWLGGASGDVWTSADGGATWIDRTDTDHAASGEWSAVTSSAAGDRVVAIGRGAVWKN